MSSGPTIDAVAAAKDAATEYSTITIKISTNK